jgi:hypothetical protein
MQVVGAGFTMETTTAATLDGNRFADGIVLAACEGVRMAIRAQTQFANLGDLSARTLRTMESRPIHDWVRRESRGGDWEPYVADWESFVLVGVYLFREIPSGFPLKQAPFGVLPELFLAQTERSDGKPIKAE